MIVRGWHFCAEQDGQPILRDGTPCPTTGAIEVFDGEPFMCVRGLHWSPRAIDALDYATGPWVRLVEGEPTETGMDKVVGRTRRTIAGPVNVERTLRGFAALCALRALRRYSTAVPRKACMPAVRCTLQYWRTGVWPEDREAARASAHAAAWDTASDAARDAVRAADWAAAWAASRNDASASGRDAARAADWAAAWAASRNDVSASGRDAARRAERDWQNRVLEAMLRKALEVKP